MVSTIAKNIRFGVNLPVIVTHFALCREKQADLEMYQPNLNSCDPAP